MSSTTKVQLLPDNVINRIKAGETIERPANVVKELVENAIDADARRVAVSLVRGGIDEIVISDDGHGIKAEDVPLAIKRHTTSKIVKADDLYSLVSLGFRGEALASISEVSNFTLTTVPKEGLGTKLVVDDDGSQSINRWQGSRGTTIVVKNLFMTIPARQKFLKSATTEYSHCCDCLQALSLSYPHVEFILIHNGKEQLRASRIDKGSPEQSLRTRTQSLFGREVAEPLLFVHQENEMASVTALFSPPGHDLRHARQMFAFVNRRWIKSQTIKYAILRGYHSHLLQGRYPFAVIDLKIHPTLLDVNVHPMKTEVRFQYAKEIQELIAIAIRRQLRTPSWSVPTPADSAPQEKPFVAPSYPQKSHSPPPPLATLKPISPPPTTNPLPLIKPINRRQPADSHSNQQLPWSMMIYLGTFADCYLLFEDNSRNLIIIDQHAFHERIIFEQLVNNPKLLRKSQALLIPEKLTIDGNEAEILRNRQREFAHLGFTIKVSDNLATIKSFPAILQQHGIAEVVSELLAIAEKDNTSWAGESVTHDVIATIACRSAIKSGDKLDDRRRQRLIAQAESVDFYHNCPHGRRVIRIYSQQTVGGWFDRLS